MPFLIGETLNRLIDVTYEVEVCEKHESSITFVITSDSTHRRMWKEKPDILLGSENYPIIVPSKNIEEQDFMSSTVEEASSSFSDLVASLAINPEDKEKLCNYLVKEARYYIKKEFSPGKKLIIKVFMHLITTHWWKDKVPAISSAIANLKKRKLMDFAAEDYRHGEKGCPICLEDFQAESLVTPMPCSHIFHGDCIDQWLRESHDCPICRFEMPTASTL